MRSEIVQGADTELGRAKCSGPCGRRLRPGQSVAVHRVSGGDFGHRIIAIHKACLVALAESMPDGTIVGTRREQEIAAGLAQIRAEAEEHLARTA